MNSNLPDLQLPFGNLREARHHLRLLEERRETLKAEGKAMVAEFRHRWPRAPAYPAPYSDRTLTAFRWRRSGHRAVSFDLTSENGQLLLKTLPPEVCKAWLAFERRRTYLNYALATTDYQRIRLVDLVERLTRINVLEREANVR